VRHWQGNEHLVVIAAGRGVRHQQIYFLNVSISDVHGFGLGQKPGQAEPWLCQARLWLGLGFCWPVGLALIFQARSHGLRPTRHSFIKLLGKKQILYQILIIFILIKSTMNILIDF